MPAFYEAGPHGHWIFLLVTVCMGGAAAFVSGKALAETWRGWWQVPVYMVILSAAVRFIHFAMFEEKLLAPAAYLTDLAYLCVLAAAGFVVARRRQMRDQYGWQPSD